MSLGDRPRLVDLALSQDGVQTLENMKLIGHARASDAEHQCSAGDVEIQEIVIVSSIWGRRNPWRAKGIAHHFRRIRA